MPMAAVACRPRRALYESRDAIFFDFERVGHIARERYVQTHKKYLRTVAHARGHNAAHSTYTRQAKFGICGLAGRLHALQTVTSRT